ncbi:AI-2E family transporter [Paramicrobacterium agarici]|uniref:AI-2E family transporter n=1 Tax=Paramicrobacterium agarici TaxID=630514 RepID=UPI00114D9CFA|nr:AI-2E family transporter [Microbacterium agarici]TQO22776.1 putative PurR-regulated permease PerM [Microbacterium agarici]
MGLFSRSSEPTTPPVRTLWTDGFGRMATRCVQIIAVLAVVAVAIYGLMQLSLVLIPVVLALIFASAFNPLMSFMRRKGVPSVLGTLIALLGSLLIVTGVVWLIVWAVRTQWDELIESANNGINQLQSYLEHLPFSIDQSQIENLRDSAVDFVTSAQFGSGALAGVSATANFFTGLVLMMVVLFFFLKDGPALWEFVLRPFVGDQYKRARRIGNKTVQTLGDYARGTSIVAAADALGIGIGLAILQVPLAVPLAVIVFLTAFIPIVGATAAGILAALVALVTNGPLAAVIVVGIVVLVNQLEGNFLQPVVMGRSLKLHALVILLALTAGTILGGIIGAVLAVPITAVAWGIISVWNGDDEAAEPFQQKRPEVA